MLRNHLFTHTLRIIGDCAGSMTTRRDTGEIFVPQNDRLRLTLELKSNQHCTFVKQVSSGTTRSVSPLI